MKVFLLTRFGGPEVLAMREMPTPIPREGEVLIRVHRIGLNFAEVFARLGVYPGIPKPPFVPGIECAGIVERVGRNSYGLKRGDKVMAFTRQGAYAEYVCTPADFVLKIPRGMSVDQGAALPVAYLSALHGLVTLAHIRRNDRVLIHAAAGGVGTAALQVAKHLGAETFGTASTEEKLRVANEQGADHTINYREKDFAEEIGRMTGGYGVDVVMDSVGGSVFRKSWKLLAPMGRYVLFGFSAVTGARSMSMLKTVYEFLQVPRIFPPSIVSKNVALMGFNLYMLTNKVEYLRGLASEAISLLKKGVVNPVIGTVFPFEKLPEAHTFLQSRKSIGKVLIRVQE
jgi:NADPH:quinone reductase-like Zn-dependent oxidoreductase